MEAILNKIKVAKEQSGLFEKLEKGKQYQIIFDSGESVVIAVLAQGKIEESEKDISGKKFEKPSEHSMIRDDDDPTTKQMLEFMAKTDSDLRDEPVGLYTLNDIKEKL